MSEPREFDSFPVKRAARHLVGQPKAAIRCRRKEHIVKITALVDSDFGGDPVSRQGTTTGCAQTERNRHLSELVVDIETGAKLSETIGTVEEL